jgi:hypothetical protein
VKKKIYVLKWLLDSGDSGVDGYWNRALTEAEQHAYFKDNYPCAYDVYGSRYIRWDMIELKGKKILPALPEDQQTS